MRMINRAAALAWLLLALALMAHAAGEATPPHGGLLQFVRALIEESSAARRVEESGNAAAKAMREQAREQHRKALAAHETGDHAGADALLAQASKLMFEAVRVADQDGAMDTKKARDFDSRLDSVEALSAAFERICDEKKCEAAMRGEVRRAVAQRVAKAKDLRRDGSVDTARSALDEAYVALKIAIEHQRDGDTLVRLLKFASKEEEYRYELDRNDTHKMLIRLLMEGKAGSEATSETRKFLDLAARFRAGAEREAAQKRFEAAIEALEGSTREYQRALRGAGIYIPG